MNVYPVSPVAKPRMTQRDTWKKRPVVMRYRAFCDKVRAAGVKLPEAGANLTFCLPMPKSWSKKKRVKMNGQPHQSRPDISNLLKALEDALFSEDSHIWHYGELKKVWAEEGMIIIG
jgi:Holliday junction resolvase RusA-like endonuclease